MKLFILAAALMFPLSAFAAYSPVIYSAPYPMVLGKGGIRFQNSDTTTTCNAAAAGAIRYNAGTFQGCNGSAWSSLGGASGANTTLSNLGTTSLNAGIIFQNGISLFPTISLATKATGNSDSMYINGGEATLGRGGDVNVSGGAADSDSQSGGDVNIAAADAAPDVILGGGAGGQVTIAGGAGDGTLGGGGAVSIIGGQTNGSGTSASGSLTLKSGSGGSGGRSNFVVVASGPSAANKTSGAVSVGSGSVSGSGVAGTLHLFVNNGGSGTNEVALSGNNMHINVASGLPVVSACGTDPTNVGNDNVGIVTVGTGGVAASCTITFVSTWTNAPSCIVVDDTTSLLLKAAATTTVLTVTQAVAFGASDKLSYHCLGYL